MESKHWVIRGSTKSAKITREVVNHSHENITYLTSDPNTNKERFEHHQDPPLLDPINRMEEAMIIQQTTGMDVQNMEQPIMGEARENSSAPQL